MDRMCISNWISLKMELPELVSVSLQAWRTLAARGHVDCRTNTKQLASIHRSTAPQG